MYAQHLTIVLSEIRPGGGEGEGMCVQHALV